MLNGDSLSMGFFVGPKKMESSKMSEEMRYLDIDELAKILGIKRSWVYGQTRLRGADAIPCLRVGKYLRFDLPKVLCWLEKRSGRDDEC